MGLQDRGSLRRAVRNFRAMPENAIVHPEGKPVEGIVPDGDTKIYTMLTNGEFVLDNPSE